MAMGIVPPSRRQRGRGTRRTPMADINVTPLVDVMLVLLIIFMVTAPLLTSAVPVDLPDSNANAMDQQPDQVTISIAADGTVYLEDQAVTEGTLGERLAGISRKADGKPPLVTLRADRKLQYDKVITVMGELNHAGFNSISLVTNSSVSAP